MISASQMITARTMASCEHKQWPEHEHTQEDAQPVLGFGGCSTHASIVHALLPAGFSSAGLLEKHLDTKGAAGFGKPLAR